MINDAFSLCLVVANHHFSSEIEVLNYVIVMENLFKLNEYIC